jgi:signal transduction histidine kinase
VYRYDKQRGLNHFSRREGLIGNEVNRSALFRDASGKVWIGNERGLAIYHPELHRDKPLPPQVRITQTENLTQNTRFEKQNLVEVDAKSTVAISFSVASYFDEEHVQIRYRLLPQMDWIYEEGQQNRTKYFHALSKGQYRFELQARDSNSDWSVSSFSPLINVKPPFYQAPWFYVLLLSVLALAGYILWRLYYLRQQEVKLNQEVEIRTRKLKESQLKLQQQNKELLQINKSLDHFTSAVSHDIKSPLNSSIGLLDLLDDSYNKEELLHFIGMVTGNLKKLRVFVQELIEISRNANQSIRSEAVDLAGLITDIFAINDTDDYSKRVDKRLVIQDHVPFYGDPSRMNVIFSNLISNAVKYQNTKEEHPFCDVRIDVLEDEAIITVKDNGRGIPKKHQEQIFEMFYRADTSVNGTGLGLFLVKEVVDKLGGSIKLNSDESSGSAFYITLPNSYSASPKKRGDEASRTTSPSDSAKHSGNQDEKLPSKN